MDLFSETFSSLQVVQVYVEWMNRSLPTPVRQLVAFERISIDAGDTEKLTLLFPTNTLNVWDDEDGYVLLTGILTQASTSFLHINNYSIIFQITPFNYLTKIKSRHLYFQGNITCLLEVSSQNKKSTLVLMYCNRLL